MNNDNIYKKDSGKKSSNFMGDSGS